MKIMDNMVDTTKAQNLNERKTITRPRSNQSVSKCPTCVKVSKIRLSILKQSQVSNQSPSSYQNPHFSHIEATFRQIHNNQSNFIKTDISYENTHQLYQGSIPLPDFMGSVHPCRISWAPYTPAGFRGLRAPMDRDTKRVIPRVQFIQ